jgi:sigma-54 dependent transcriptional regulator
VTQAAEPPVPLIHEDPVSKTLLSRLAGIAATGVSVLITGETGTGKELAARHVHALSPRREQPFVAVNCGAVPEDLLESEFFGHERGAFTGANTERAGWFEAAHGGTLFLDEIGDLPLPMQVKLLRVLQEREVTRLGSRQARPIDVRLVTATNIDLGAAMLAGKFREDLYYRLDVASLHLAPLRDRRGDIAPLARRFLKLHGERLGKRGFALSDEALDKLQRHGWPGNIRELENVIQRALIGAAGSVIGASALSFGWRTQRGVQAAAAPKPDVTAALTASMLNVLEADVPRPFDLVVDTLIATAFDFCDRNQLQTAASLGISRNVLRAHLARLGYIQARHGLAVPIRSGNIEGSPVGAPD